MTFKILAILDNYLHDNPDEIAKEIAVDFRRRLHLSIGLYGSAFFECFRMFPFSSLMMTLAYFLF